MLKSTIRLLITGIVQGVGFRPFIHRVAEKYGLDGFVRNVGGSEVEVVVCGEPSAIAGFIESLYTEKPPPAVIEEIEISVYDGGVPNGFRIMGSGRESYKRSMIPPDLSICRWCLEEILDPSNRRYRYPFNSCAWCGPRLSMIYSVPYDRENTSMRKYRLCSDCLREYSDLNNLRRYHAQGISCPVDGPKLVLLDSDGELVETSDPIVEAARLVDEGYIVAVKGIGGYHIAALASDDDVVAKLRIRKKRPRKPFAVMALDLNVLERLVYVSDYARKLLCSIEKPIVLLPKREDSPVSKLVSPGLDKEGVFLPYTGLHYLLLMETRDKFLIMTSGNVHGKPMCINEECVFRYLRSIADYYLIHDREIVNRVDDSVVRYSLGRPVILRWGRGYAPRWIRLWFRMRYEYIGFGGEFQTSPAIGFEDKIVLAQYVGDIDDVDVIIDYRKILDYYIRNYRVDLGRAILVVDMHPGYNTRDIAIEYSRRFGSRVVEVQHHIAHLMATVVDSGVRERVVGIAIDGTGYGIDGAIWGGEVIALNPCNGWFERIGHLEYQPLVGEKSIYYPLRFFLSVLSRVLDYSELYRLVVDKRLYDRLPNGVNELPHIVDSVKKGYYTPTSSTGRFLDGIAGFLGVCWYRSYEGEPAIRLEVAGVKGRLLDILYPRIKRCDGLVVDTTAMYLEVLEGIEKHSIGDLAYTIQYRLGEALALIAIEYLKGRRNYGDKIVLGGGAAVNDIILAGMKSVFDEHGYEIVLPRRIPVNDGGVAVGQIAYAYTLVES